MVAIDSQETLRSALQGLQEADLVRSNGPLERRGVEVDHNLYPPGENHEQLTPLADEPDEAPAPRPSTVASPAACETRPVSASSSMERVAALETLVSELRDEISSVRSEFRELQDRFEDLRRQLGG
jgi:hypothetical protein